MQNNQPKLEKFEIVKFGPYRFIGKSVYASNARGTSEIFEFFREHSDWVFEELNALKEYASDDKNNIALSHFELYDPEEFMNSFWKDKVYYGKPDLFGYTIGRFMKADTPVPEGLNYIDIFELFVAKAWIKSNNKFGMVNQDLIFDEIRRTGIYDEASHIFKADVFPVSIENDISIHKVYMACEIKNSPQT